MKALIEFFPILMFFIVNKFFGITPATASLIIFSIICYGYIYIRYKNIPPLTLLSLIVLIGFGILTIIFNDAIYIKLKPTVASLLLAIVLLGGMLFKKNIIQNSFQEQIQITDKGWTFLSWSWIVFFITIAASNETARIYLSTDQWVNFKVFGLTLLTILFIPFQIYIIKKYSINK